VRALAGLRLAAFVRAYHAVAPLVAGLIVLSVLYGGGVAPSREAYGVSAVVLFPVLAWQAKILLDAEPDVQRRLARVAARSADVEIGAGLLAAGGAALATILIGLVLPWVFGGVKGPSGLLAGGWVHLLSAVPALALGALASRPIARTAGAAVSVLVGGSVLAIVLGQSFSPVPFLVPPLMPAARFLAGPSMSTASATGTVLALTGWALAWSAVAGGGYWWLRRRRV
jgi:hypothetical protein